MAPAGPLSGPVGVSAEPGYHGPNLAGRPGCSACKAAALAPTLTVTLAKRLPVQWLW
jgi:hypothetical protein